MTGRRRTEADYKRCPRCGELKLRERDFTHRSNGTVFSWCKTCNTDYRRAKREEARAARDA